MRTRTPSLILALVGLLVFAPALTRAQFHQNSTAVQIKVTVQPHFPFALSNHGIYEGDASFLIVIDQQGTMRDFILLETTHPKFGEAVSEVLPRWEFGPATINGIKINAASRIDIHFHQSGTVISLNGGRTLTDVFISELDSDRHHKQAYHVSDLSDLDRLPEPLQIVEPALPAPAARQLAGRKVVYHFFIDKAGRVRIPYLEEAQVAHIDEQVLDALYDALVQWEFTPPTVNGELVVSRAAQPFWIQPDAAARMAPGN